MYQFLKGIITEKITEPPGQEKLILEVNGVGYEINTSLSTLELIGKKGETSTVYTTLIHKEDQMSLIGFLTLIERELFNLLLSVSGIGPKSALNLLNNLTVSEITSAILNEDISNLRRAQGIGERTASRVILELKEKIKNWQYLPVAYSEREQISERAIGQNNESEARSVLQSLGYSSQEISQAFIEAKKQRSKEAEKQDSESLIHFSLKWLSAVRK